MDLGTGWNLGNTLDAHNADSFINQPENTETSWGQPMTTKEMIDGLARSGIKTIRLPVSWTPHVNVDYEINEQWMNRVKTIVDWCMENNLYVILNIHHDNYINDNIVYAFQGYYPSLKAKDKSVEFVSRIWTQIAEAFADDRYENVIFETLNEPRLRGTPDEWNYNPENPKCLEAMEMIKILNQRAVQAIRSAGGTNKSRLIMVPSYVASPDAAFNSAFEFPADIEGNKEKIALSVHMYTPYNFAMNCGEGGYCDFTMQTKSDIDYYFNRLKSEFIDRGHPVIIGEYGATNKNNKADRMVWFDYYVKESYSKGIYSILWDNGIIMNEENPAESFGFFNRTTCTWYDEDIRKTILHAVACKN